MKTLPKCFENYFQLASQVHIYSTRFAANENWSVPRFKKTYTQRSIKYKGTILWNALSADLRDNYLKSYAIFVNRLKQFLQCNQYCSLFSLFLIGFTKLADAAALSNLILSMNKRIIVCNRKNFFYFCVSVMYNFNFSVCSW